ncbi:hypothetical protein HBN50_09865 [Halobacteriovorax sp. GB3]|uniref:hypothetical protein n=1 Tax=Halobacteriovorax sp. GB3 TaxID=2719615 RepID=UPI00235F8E81|nr:hypothetical protein [Halobacteriovorax sp. GB3]MDD0853405.1 hypothetical protein [Halobacteriovorax sp. GB3]
MVTDLNRGKGVSYYSFYTKNLHRFLSPIPALSIFAFDIFDTLSQFSARDCEYWVNTNIEFLSPVESLAVGISLCRSNDLLDSGNLEKAFRFFEYARSRDNEDEDERQKEISFFATIGLSILSFEKGLRLTDSKKYSKQMLISEHYLDEAEDIYPKQELTYLYRTIVQASLGEYGMAIKYISRASKIVDINIAYLEVLEKFYRGLGMDNVATFYLNRIQKDQNRAPEYKKSA